MSRPIPSPLHVARHILETDKAWLFFVKIELAGSTIRLVKSRRHIQADGVVWQASSVLIDLPSEDGSGALGEMVISVPNVSRLPISYVEAQGELLGRDVTAYLQHESSLDVFVDALSWRNRILSCEITAAQANFRCEPASGLHKIPSVVFNRNVSPQDRKSVV